MNIFDRARQMVAQSPHPTTLGEQLAKLSKRRRRRTYGTMPAMSTEQRKAVESPRYSWQEIYQ